MHTAPRRRARLLVTDLDNTLWDWFDVWHESFSAMLERLIELSGVPAEELEAEIREVHQRRGTTEYSYLLNELPSLRAATKSDREPLEVYDDAIHILNKVRFSHTQLYPGVAATLRSIREQGVPIVAYSESLAYWTEWRIRRTGLDGVIDVLYTSPDHDFPSGVSANKIRRRPATEYGLRETKHRHVHQGLSKPNSAVLTGILEEFDTEPDDAVYIGDSLMKDVAMAQSVGVIDVHASYGVAQQRSGYGLLRRVSHWTDADIERERRLQSGCTIIPSYELKSSFVELLDLFDFRREGA